jgi:hypothetical protein
MSPYVNGNFSIEIIGVVKNHLHFYHKIFIVIGNYLIGLSFNAELLGIGRGKDALPSTVLAPPSVFPPLVSIL